MAFTAFGEGPIDLAITQARVPIDLMWEFPRFAAFMEALGRMVRVIVWDGRGFGASDPIRDLSAANAETYSDDVAAVLDAAGSERATLFEMNASAWVNQLGQSGTGVEHYHSGGNTKFLKIDSECAWTVSVTAA
jgi:hypothetical protein